MKHTIILFIFLFSVKCFSQSDLILHDKIKYMVSNKLIEYNRSTLINNSNHDLVIWFSQNQPENYNDYFKKKKGDFSLLDWLNDENFDNYNIHMYLTFIKILKPNCKFDIFYKSNLPVINKINIDSLPSYIKNSLISSNKYNIQKLYNSDYIIFE